MTDPLVTPAEVERLLPEARLKHGPLLKLEAQRDRVKQAQHELYLEYQHRSNGVSIKLAAIDKQIKLEEIYLKRKIAEGLRKKPTTTITTTNETESPQ